MHMVYAALILVAAVALGDFISVKTRARVPMLFVAMFVYLIALWLGMPKDLPIVSQLGMFGVVMVAPLIVHMGTIIPFAVLREQWKAIIIALIAMAVAAALILGIARLMFGYERAVAGCAPVLGGIIAALLTIEGLKAVGLPALGVISAMILAVQMLVGLPIAANFLRRHALKIEIKPAAASNLEAKSEAKKAAIPYGTDENPSPRYKAWLPKKWETASIMLLKLFAVGALAVALDKLTHGHVNYSIFCIILGLTGSYFGFFRGKMLERANSLGIAMVGLIIYVMTTLNEVTPQSLAAEAGAIFGILFIGIIGLLIGGWLGGRLVRWPRDLAIPVALTALFGFPGNWLICDEASRTVGKTKDEQSYINGIILPPMLVGGFTTVTITSIIVAGILVGTL